MNWFSKLGRKNDKKPKFRKKSYGYSWKFFVTVVCRSIKKQAVPADSCFWKNFIATVCRSIKNIYGKLSAFLISRREEELLNSKGVILIEFAVCMPILIILMFYINDLVKIKRYYSQTEFVGQQMANIIQNITKNRTNKRIYLPDFRRALALSFLTIYPGTTMFKQGSGYPLAHMPHLFIYYVTKDDNASTVSCRWMSRVSAYNTSAPPSNINTSKYTSDHSCSIVRYKTSASPSQIYSSLKLNSEPKMIIESSLMTVSSATWEYNTAGNKIPLKQALGLHIVNPKYRGGWYRFFQTVVIFAPKPGLFTNDYPTES